MDWADSPELIEIFEAELDERGNRLVAAGMALADGTLSPDSLDDHIRDAHTLKGSAHMIGRSDLGETSAVLEKAWRAVKARQLLVSADLGRVLADISGAVVRSGRDLQALTPHQTTIAGLLEWAEGSVPPRTAGVDREGSSQSPFDWVSSEASLGGLLGSVEAELSASVTRVDTAGLYRLINRAVELEIEAASIVDLSYVTIEPADPARMIAAWRSQLERMAAEIAGLRKSAVALSNVRFGEVAETFPQFIKFLGRRLDKEVEIVLKGAELEVDRQIVDMLREPLRHILVNAIDHGIELGGVRIQAGKPEVGQIDVEARLVDGQLLVAVTDDGAGVRWDEVARLARSRGWRDSPAELDSVLFRHGFSTVTTPNDFSGTGEGLAVVADMVDRVGGSVSIVSQPGVGTSIRLELPASLVLQRVVVIAAGDQFFGISESAVLDELPELPPVSEGHPPTVQWRRQALPLVSFSRAMHLAAEPEPRGLVISSRSGRFVLAVSESVDRRPVAVKALGPILDDASHLVGAALLGAGEVLVVVDHHYLGESWRAVEANSGRRPRVLVVDDSAGVRQLITITLRGKGFDVTPASGAREAVLAIAHNNFDLLVVDYAMPRSNGADLVRALRNNKVRIPIVMVSGVADESDKAAAWSAGVDAYLDKYDLRSGALVDTISKLLSESSVSRR